MTPYFVIDTNSECNTIVIYCVKNSIKYSANHLFRKKIIMFLEIINFTMNI